MIVHLRAFGILEDYLGRQGMDVNLPDGSTIVRLYSSLTSLWQVKPPADIWDPEHQQLTLAHLLMIDGHDIQDENTVLVDGCDILLIPPLEGG